VAFRGDLDAARARADSLAEQVDRLAQSNAASAEELAAVRKQLADAQREVRRLSALEPGSAARRRAPYRTILFVALGLIIATAVAGYHSETIGVTMSYFAAVLIGLGVGGWIGAGRSRGVGIGCALGGSFFVLVALAFFYGAIWPSL
jgi:hypothetical protein